MDKVKILMICGSISENSHTHVLLREAETAYQKLGCDVGFWDLKTRPLPIADPAYHWKVDHHPDEIVRQFAQEVRKADGVVLGTPLYHGSFSGVLKNALDNLWMDAFNNKPVALMSHGHTLNVVSRPCDALMPVIKTMYGYTTQTLVTTGKVDYDHNEGKPPQLNNIKIRERIARQCIELWELAGMLKKHRLTKEDGGTENTPQNTVIQELLRDINSEKQP